MSELDVQQFFSLSKDDISAVCERFRDDRRVAAAIQLLFLRASGRPMDRFAAVPKVLLRSVCEALGSPSVSIASLRSLYERRQTLYEHQAWARTYLGLGDLDEVQLQKIEQVLAVAALEAAHPDDLVRTARIWLYGRRIIIPGSRRIADWARKAFDATEAAMAATIEAAIGKATLRQAIDWAYAPSPATSGSHLEWLKTPPQRHAPSTTVDPGEDPRSQGLGGAQLGIGFHCPKQAAGLRGARPDAPAIDDRASNSDARPLVIVRPAPFLLELA